MIQSAEELFVSITFDAPVWKALKLWNNALSPDEQAEAMEHIVDMLLCITNDTRRAAYIKSISDASKQHAQNHLAELSKLKKSIAQATKTRDKLLQKKHSTPAAEEEIAAAKAQVAELEAQQQGVQAMAATILESGDLKKALTAATKKRDAKAAEEKRKASFEKSIRSADDAGMPSDFNGSLQDVYDAIKYGVYVHENIYWSRGKTDYPVSNFTMKVLYHVETGEEQAYRLIAVKNVYGFEVVINLNTDDFVSLGSFKKVLARKGDFIFKGSDADLTRLQEFLQKDEIKTDHVKTLGYQPRGNFWAWANGIMPLKPTAEGQLDFMPADDFGIVTYQDRNYFLPACSKMFAEKDDLFINEKKFRYIEPATKFSFKDWSAMFHNTYGKKSIAGILFYIGALYRDITMKQIQRFPLLNLFGPPGAGKGQMAESIMAMFGERQDQIMLGGASTVVGFMRKFAQFRNSIVWLDEYKNNLTVKFLESFKNIYDGKGYERGKMTNDFTTESTPIHSSCILSGQDMPTQEPALFMRVIMVAFQDGKFSEEQRTSFQTLKNEFEMNGLSNITADLFRHRNLVQENFKDRLQIIFKETIRDVANTEVDDRMIMNIAILLTYMHLLQDVLQFPWSYRDAKKFLIENMLQQHRVLAGNNDLAKFWGVVESMFYQDIVSDDKDFKLEDGYIYLRLMQVHPLYVKELKNRGDANFLSKSTLEHYLTLDPTVYVDHVRKRFSDGSNNWCYKMKYNKLGIDLIRLQKTHGMNAGQHDYELQQKYREMGVDEEMNLYSETSEEISSAF